MLTSRSIYVGLVICAAVWTARTETVPLWPRGAPGALGDTPEDRPELTIFLAPANHHVSTGIVVCPGGGYHALAMAKEGTDVAAWLNRLGISAFVLKYRLGPRYHHPVELGDAQRAIRYVRAHAADYGLAPNRIGIMGFSAGGHLASSTGTHFDSGQPQASDAVETQSSRPDFMILAYPVITLQDPYAHVGSRTNLLGQTPNPQLMDELSNELQVKRDTPPTFLFHTTDDEVVPVENSTQFYASLRRAGIPVEMHIYIHGRHGVGLAQAHPALRKWPEQLMDWLKEMGLL